MTWHWRNENQTLKYTEDHFHKSRKAVDNWQPEPGVTDRTWQESRKSNSQSTTLTLSTENILVFSQEDLLESLFTSTLISVLFFLCFFFWENVTLTAFQWGLFWAITHRQKTPQSPTAGTLWNWIKKVFSGCKFPFSVPFHLFLVSLELRCLNSIQHQKTEYGLFQVQITLSQK